MHIGFILLLHLAQTGLTLLLLYSHMTVKSSGFVSLFPSSSSPQGVSLADFEDVVKSAATCLQSDFDVKRFALRLKSFKTFLSSVFHRGTDRSALVSVSLDLCVCVCVCVRVCVCVFGGSLVSLNLMQMQTSSCTCRILPNSE